jgi:hypothetical protein
MKTAVGGPAAAQASLCDLLDRLIDTGVVARGSLVVSVAGIELIYIEVNLLIASIETAFGKRRAAPHTASSPMASSPKGMAVA